VRERGATGEERYGERQRRLPTGLSPFELVLAYFRTCGVGDQIFSPTHGEIGPRLLLTLCAVLKLKTIADHTSVVKYTFTYPR
jgi:hypothetical protein